VSRRRSLALAAGAAGAASTAALVTDRRRIAADPLRPALEAPLAGEPVTVEAADGAALQAEVFGPADAPPVVLVHVELAVIPEVGHMTPLETPGDVTSRPRKLALTPERVAA
jgi:hypothetical protein